MGITAMHNIFCLQTCFCRYTFPTGGSVVVFAGGHVYNKPGSSNPLGYTPTNAVDIFQINPKCISQCSGSSCDASCYTNTVTPLKLNFVQMLNDAILWKWSRSVGHFRNFRLQTMPVSIAFAQGMLSAELAALLHNQPQPSKYSKQYSTTQTDPHLRAIVFKFSGRRHCRHKNGNNFLCRSALIIVFECVLIFTLMITPGICRGIFCAYNGLALYHFKRSQRLRRNCVSFEHDSIPQQSKEHKTAT